jgi:apolipoprotein D and lipocalin family protein
MLPIATRTKTGASASWIVWAIMGLVLGHSSAPWQEAGLSNPRRSIFPMNRTVKALACCTFFAGTATIQGCAALGPKHPVGNAAVPQPARSVDIGRYLGRWHELARYEQGFQKDCEGVTADYSLRDDGKIRVVNTCRKPDGRITDAVGKAKIVDSATNAKLKVSFFGPFYGNYWVLDRAEDYSWAIIGEPSGRYLWLLSREAVPGQARLDAMTARARELGYDTALLRVTQQP